MKDWIELNKKKEQPWEDVNIKKIAHDIDIKHELAWWPNVIEISGRDEKIDLKNKEGKNDEKKCKERILTWCCFSVDFNNIFSLFQFDCGLFYRVSSYDVFFHTNRFQALGMTCTLLQYFLC